MHRLLFAATACLALGLGCLGDDDEDRERQQAKAREYSRTVERLTDEAYDHGVAAITMLSRVGDGKASPRRGRATLDRLAVRVAATKARLAKLRPPAAAQRAARDLEAAVGALELHLRIAAVNVRTAGRRRLDLRTVATADARTLLAYGTGLSALSRAVRTLAVEPAR